MVSSSNLIAAPRPAGHFTAPAEPVTLGRPSATELLDQFTAGQTLIRETLFRPREFSPRTVEPLQTTELLSKALLRVGLNPPRGEAAVDQYCQIYLTATKLTAQQFTMVLKDAFNSLATEDKMIFAGSFITFGAWFQTLGQCAGSSWGAVRNVFDDAIKEIQHEEPLLIVRSVLLGARAALLETRYWNCPSLTLLAGAGGVAFHPTSDEHLESSALNRAFGVHINNKNLYTWRRASADTLTLCNPITHRPIGYAQLPDKNYAKSDFPVSLNDVKALIRSCPDASTSLRKKVAWVLQLYEQVVRPLALHETGNDQHNQRAITSSIAKILKQFLPAISQSTASDMVRAVEDYRADAATLLSRERDQRSNFYNKQLQLFNREVLPLIESSQLSAQGVDLELTHYAIETDPVRKMVLARSILDTCIDLAREKGDESLGERLEEYLDDLTGQDGEDELSTDILLQERHGSKPNDTAKKVASQANFDRDLPQILNALSAVAQRCTSESIALRVAAYDSAASDRSLFPFDVEGGNESFANMLRALDHREVQIALERDIGVDIRELTRLEQIHLFRFLRDSDPATVDRLKGVLHRHHLNSTLIVRSLVGYAESAKPVQALLCLSEKLPVHLLVPTLSAFLNITHAAQSAKRSLAVHSDTLATDPTLVEKIAQATISRANKLLTGWAALMQGDAGRDSQVQETFLQLVQSIEGSSVVFAAIFKEALRNNDLNSIKGLSVAEEISGNLSEDEKREMITLSAANNAILYQPHFRDLVDSAFEETLSKANERFYILRINGKIEGFARFSELGPGEKYFGSFNVSPVLEGFKLGGKFLEAMLEHEGADSKVTLLVTENNPFKEAYVEKYGFQQVEVLENFDLGVKQVTPTGVTVLKMQRMPPVTEP